MPKIKLLLIEDEMSLAILVRDNLEQAGYSVKHARNGEEGLKLYHQTQPDLIVLDVMMPKANGFEVAQTIRNTDKATPIIFLTAKVQVKDLVKGFESGGNDYIRKPFSIEELLVRIRVMLNQNRLLDTESTVDDRYFKLGQFNFDSKSYELSMPGKVQKLTAKEATLLKLFCENPDETLTKKSILIKVWGDDSFLNSRSLDVFISKLRKYLKADPAISIVNIRGVGYRMWVNR